MAYATEEDLLVGDLELHPALDVEKFINDAANEINSKLGTVFQVPIPVGSTATVEPHARLTLKRINAHLASGRLILAVAQGGEDGSLHAYGRYLVNEAQGEIRQILADPEGMLPGALVRDDLLTDTGPTIAQQDATSPVEAFYGEFSSLGSLWGPGH